MNIMKRILFVILFVVAMLLLIAETDSWESTLMLKAGGIAVIILITYLWQILGMDKDKKINKFLND
jgi:4-amino-4-deoxy-L-arabinose transferase-like glycosyltransferase